jgi:predicted solute-binding protein
MINHFDMAREMTRLMDAGKSTEECATEILRMFPSATGADLERALCIGLDHLKMLEAEQMAACQDLADKWFNAAPEPVIDAAIQHLKDAKLQPSAETLFPKPDKTKS